MASTGSGGDVKLKALDLFCCAGGATRGYQLAGFHVTGVDIDPQPNYCGDVFVQGDAIEYARKHATEYDFVHASPPCQLYSVTQKLAGKWHPDLISATRGALVYRKIPFVIENVEGARAELQDPATLCGSMFGLRTYRHRLFEVHGFEFYSPNHPEHVAVTAKMGRKVADDEYMHVVGHFSGVELGRAIMEMPWASRHELAEAIPPAYTRYIGEQWLAQRQG